MTHKKYAESLRMIADFFEVHEEIDLPNDSGAFNYFRANTRDEMAKLARALGDGVKKEYDKDFGGSVALSKTFGSIDFRVIAYRSSVCKRIVTGKQMVERRVIPETVIEAHEEDVYEWDCSEPLLAEETETVK